MANTKKTERSSARKKDGERKTSTAKRKSARRPHKRTRTLNDVEVQGAGLQRPGDRGQMPKRTARTKAA